MDTQSVHHLQGQCQSRHMAYAYFDIELEANCPKHYCYQSVNEQKNQNVLNEHTDGQTM